MWKLTEDPPRSMVELLSTAGKVMNEEEAMAAKYEEENRGSTGKSQGKKEGKKRSGDDKFAHYTPLTVSCEHILNEIKTDRALRWP